MIRREVPELTLSGVSRVYRMGNGAPVRALDGVGLVIPGGEFLSVEGPSGCGKTTLLNVLGLLDEPTEGSLAWSGRPVGHLPERERARLRLTSIGFIFQRFFLLPTLTAVENVELPMRALGRGRTERRERALQLLGEVGLNGRQDAYPHQLSGGEEQRVAIARALANGPGLVLADEPTGELDSANTAVILDLLARAHQQTGASVVLVTHNPVVARRAQRHLRMQDGRVVEDRRGE